MFLQSNWVGYIFQVFNIHSLLCCWFFPSKTPILFFVLQSSWTKKTKSAVLMTCFVVRALISSTLKAAFLHQGFNQYFFLVEGKQVLSEIDGSCPLHRICSTDWWKDAKCRILSQGLGISARFPKKNRLDFFHKGVKFRIGTSVFENVPSEASCSEK